MIFQVNCFFDQSFRPRSPLKEEMFCPSKPFRPGKHHDPKRYLKQKETYPAMLRNQIKFFVRIFLKDKFFSTLNILGLALGIAVSIILLLILQNDLTTEQYHEKHKRIYRLGGHLQATGVDGRRSRTARELGVILKEE